MELTGFGPSHRLKTHNASLPSHHSKPALPMAQTSRRNTLSLSVLLLWWVERYSERRKMHDWLKWFNCFRAAQSTRLRTSAIWKLAIAIQEGEAGHSHLWKPLWMSRSVNHKMKKICAGTDIVQTFITHDWHHILRNLLLPFGKVLMAKDSFGCVFSAFSHFGTTCLHLSSLSESLPEKCYSVVGCLTE